MCEAVAEEAKLLLDIAQKMLDRMEHHDALILDPLLAAIQNCAERSEQAGQNELANSLDDAFLKLSGQVRKKTSASTLPKIAPKWPAKYKQELRDALDRSGAQIRLLRILMREWKLGDSEDQVKAELKKLGELLDALPRPPSSN